MKIGIVSLLDDPGHILSLMKEHEVYLLEPSPDMWWRAEELELDLFIDIDSVSCQEVKKVRPGTYCVTWGEDGIDSWLSLRREIDRIAIVYELGGFRRFP